MEKNNTIYVFEFGWLVCGKYYGRNGDIQFTHQHFKLLAQFITQQAQEPYFTVYFDRIRFCNYVGVISIDNLTIEVLPKVDKHDANQPTWQQVMLEMLLISIQVKAKTTSFANIQIRHHSVLETYIQLFLEETQKLIHHGLVKKYKVEEGNQSALKGKLLLQKHITKNIVHAERFYVAHQIYSQDNVYNSILKETLYCIQKIKASSSTIKCCVSIIEDFPECCHLKITYQLFDKLSYDRKTERYRKAIELAKIILLNYHPDIKGGRNNILAIMFDMNLLWECYIYAMLIRAKRKSENSYKVEPQKPQLFWKHPDNWKLHLIPDLVVTNNNTKETIILDTKWKYQSSTSADDVRQMYAYGSYFNARRRYLLFPDKVNEVVKKVDGPFYDIDSSEFSKKEKCGLFFIDILLENNQLNKDLGVAILEKCF